MFKIRMFIYYFPIHNAGTGHANETWLPKPCCHLKNFAYSIKSLCWESIRLSRHVQQISLIQIHRGKILMSKMIPIFKVKMRVVCIFQLKYRHPTTPSTLWTGTFQTSHEKGKKIRQNLLCNPNENYIN